MKDNKFSFSNSRTLDEFRELIEKQKTKITGMASVKGGHLLVEFGLNLIRLIEAKVPTKGKVRNLRIYFKSVYLLVSRSGLAHTVKYLKTAAVLLQQYVAKDITRPNSRDVGGVAVSRTKGGLPRIIPKDMRKEIRRGNTNSITLALSLLNIYRYLISAHNLKDALKTIVTPGIGWIPSEDFQVTLEAFWKCLRRKGVDYTIPPFSPRLSQSVSVAVNMLMKLRGSSLYAAVAAVQSFRVWKSAWSSILYKEENFFGEWKPRFLPRALAIVSSKLWPAFRNIYDATIDWSPLREHQPIQPSSEIGPNKAAVVDPRTQPRSAWVKPNAGLLSGGHPHPLGRLVFLKEAAGKVRTIAIVDPITNWVLSPLHDWIFKKGSAIHRARWYV